MNPNGGPLSCPIYSCLDKYKVTPRKPQVEYTVSSFNVLLVHCKCFDHKNYGDWKKRGPCRENLHYLWKRAVRIAGFPSNYGVLPQFLQPLSLDSADFPCRGPAFSSPCSFYGQNICSASGSKFLPCLGLPSKKHCVSVN